jgi:biotin transport system substrate-specific component
MTTRPQRFTSRDLALVAVFVGIVAALGLVPPFYAFGNAVPITAQSMGVMLAGAVLGARRGGLALVVFVALVALGLPLLSGGRGGLGVFATPTVGFLVGFPVAAYVVGLLSQLGGSAYSLVRGVAANVLGGIAVLYVFGIAGVMLVSRVGVDAAATGMAVFLPQDVLKAVVAAVVARGVHAGYPGLLTRQGSARDERQSSAV